MRKLYVVPVALVALVLSGAIANAAKIPLTASSAVPAAQGQVETGHDKNGNTTITLEVEHLANPENLTPPASVYVVWFQEKDGTAQNKGQMKMDKDLKAKFESTTASKSFDVFITGERDYGAKYPAGIEVMRASVKE